MDTILAAAVSSRQMGSPDGYVAAVYLGTTAKFLAAHRFYEKNGFREIAREALPDSFPVMAVDTKFYTLAL